MVNIYDKNMKKISTCSINNHIKVESPKVSVIIPVYNVEKYISQALESVVHQTLDEIEIICINDCTPDNSFEIVKQYALHDKRFVLLEQETNQGQGVARNRALDIAKGDYIMFLDPDDWYELDACEKAYNQISKNLNDMVFFNLYIQKEKRGKFYSKKLNVNRLKPFRQIIENQHIKLSDIENIWLTTCWTVVQIYSKEFLNTNQIRYSNNRFAEDCPFFIKACTCSNSISILDEPLYTYREEVIKKNINYSMYFDDVIATKAFAHKTVLQNGSTNLIRNFVVYQINSDLYWLKVFSRKNKKIRQDFFNMIKEKCEKFSSEYPVELLKTSSKYCDFELILRCKNYQEYKLKRIYRKFLKKVKICQK